MLSSGTDGEGVDVVRLTQPLHLVGDHGASEPFQVEGADRRRLDRLLRRREGALTNERLAREACVLSREATFVTGPRAP
jgi:hypothetical protein